MNDDQINLADAVDEAIASGAFGPAEAGVVALVRRYAIELDAAASVEAEFAELIGDPELRGTAYQRLSKLESRVRASQTVEAVGPKLLAALESLGLSPVARAKLTRGVEAKAPAAKSVPEDELSALRTERIRRT